VVYLLKVKESSFQEGNDKDLDLGTLEINIST
jgi:hypothetical protein